MPKVQRNSDKFPRILTVEMFFYTTMIISGFVLLYCLFFYLQALPLLFVMGSVFTASVVVLIRLSLDPDSVRARQTDFILKLASQMLEFMSDGLTYEAAQKICALFLPSTAAIAVAITDTEYILGYVGHDEENNLSGYPIQTQATRQVLAEGVTAVKFSPEEIGISPYKAIKAAIVVPLKVGSEVKGTLKFYYRRSRQITETQKSIAEGFGLLLSTELSALALDEQQKLATGMELKMLQSQINPHFLFNTINTIASFVRTDPERARVLLRDFAAFFRTTLENSADLILFGQEIALTQHYFTLELARFGSERLEFKQDVSEEARMCEVLPFLVQPLVENAVRHALPPEGKLKVWLRASLDGANMTLTVEDNGLGMSDEVKNNIFESNAHTAHKGLGIAMKNVHDRITNYYAPGTFMTVESELGVGTKIVLFLKGAAAGLEDAEEVYTAPDEKDEVGAIVPHEDELVNSVADALLS